MTCLSFLQLNLIGLLDNSKRNTSARENDNARGGCGKLKPKSVHLDTQCCIVNVKYTPKIFSYDLQTLLMTTLWCQIRTAQSLLGLVVKYPRVDFCGPCFSSFLHPVIFIQTMFFTSIPLWLSFRLRFFKLLHQECYCDK